MTGLELPVSFTPAGAELAAAFAAFQAAVSDPKATETAQIQPKDQSKPPFSYHYADLASILQLVRPLLAENGLAVTQDVTSDDQHVHVRTMLLHSSGQGLSFGPLSLPCGGEPKNWGSAATYARRFAILAVLGIAADTDDDAKAAARGATRGRRSNATDRQLAKIAAEQERAEVTDDQLGEVLHKRYTVETTGELTVEQASDLIDRLVTEADRRVAAKVAGADPTTGEMPASQAAADTEDDGEPPGVGAEGARDLWGQS